jgi:hypothetical protein
MSLPGLFTVIPSLIRSSPKTPGIEGGVAERGSLPVREEEGSLEFPSSILLNSGRIELNSEALASSWAEVGMRLGLPSLACPPSLSDSGLEIEAAPVVPSPEGPPLVDRRFASLLICASEGWIPSGLGA